MRILFRHHNVSILLLILGTFARNVNLTCPSDMIQVNPTLCIVQLNGTTSLCDAGRQCAEYGRSKGRAMFLIGRNFKNVLNKSYIPGTYMWTSFTLFLSNVVNSKVGWRDGDPRDPLFQITSEDDLPWGGENLQRPGGASFININTGVFHVAPTNFNNKAETVCELVTEMKNLPKSMKYHKNYPFNFTDEIPCSSPSLFGCIEGSFLSTLLACTLNQLTYPNYTKEFMLCRYETHDPRVCVKEGKAVTSCAQDFFRRVKKHCAEEFTAYFTCLHKHGGPTYKLKNCRTLQYPFDACIKENLKQDRPELNYFNRTRLHKTERAKPVPDMAPMPERLPDLPDFANMPEPERLADRRKMNDWLA